VERRAIFFRLLRHLLTLTRTVVVVDDGWCSPFLPPRPAARTTIVDGGTLPPARLNIDCGEVCCCLVACPYHLPVLPFCFYVVILYTTTAPAAAACLRSPPAVCSPPACRLPRAFPPHRCGAACRTTYHLPVPLPTPRLPRHLPPAACAFCLPADTLVPTAPCRRFYRASAIPSATCLRYACCA